MSELANSNHPWSDQDDSDLLDAREIAIRRQIHRRRHHMIDLDTQVGMQQSNEAAAEQQRPDQEHDRNSKFGNRQCATDASSADAV